MSRLRLEQTSTSLADAANALHAAGDEQAQLQLELDQLPEWQEWRRLQQAADRIRPRLERTAAFQAHQAGAERIRALQSSYTTALSDYREARSDKSTEA